jgi:hypothetical protein
MKYVCPKIYGVYADDDRVPGITPPTLQFHRKRLGRLVENSRFNRATVVAAVDDVLLSEIKMTTVTSRRLRRRRGPHKFRPSFRDREYIRHSTGVLIHHEILAEDKLSRNVEENDAEGAANRRTDGGCTGTWGSTSPK